MPRMERPYVCARARAIKCPVSVADQLHLHTCVVNMCGGLGLSVYSALQLAV